MKTRPPLIPTALSVAVFSAGLLLGVSSFPGCGQKSDTTSAKSAAGDKSRKRAKDSQPLADNGNGARYGNEIYVKDGRKYFGKIPLDVFHEDAYAVASDKRLVGSAGMPSNGKPSPKAVVNDTKPKPKSGEDWSSVVTGEILAAEAKRIRNSLTEKLLNVGRYSRAFREVQGETATLAAVAQVVSMHSGDVSWKKDALYVRDLATAMNATATKGTGKKILDEIKVSFEKFGDIMNRSKPADLKKPEEGVTLDTSADRGGLMKRMNAAHAWLKKDVTDEETFKAKKEQVKHEATVLALLSKVISDESYTSADEDDYRQFAKNMVDASKEMVAAVNVESFKSYRTAVDKIINNCNNCHTDYKE